MPEDSSKAAHDPRRRVLVADDEEDIVAVLADILGEHGYNVATARDGASAWEKYKGDPFGVVITDLKMPVMGGLELLRRVQESGNSSLVVVMTGFATVQTAIEALKIGAFDYILKPFKVAELLQIVERAFDKIRLEEENLQLKEQIALLRLSQAVTSSLSLDEVLAIAVEAALKEVNADGVELLFRPPGSREFSRRLGLGREGPLPPMMTDPERLESELAHVPYLQVCDADVAPLLAPGMSQGVRCILSVPLRRGREILGVMNAYVGGARKAFLPREEKALFVLGDRAAASLENALLYSDLENTFRQTIQGFALALEAKDAYTHGHSENVTRLCDTTASQMGLDDGFRAMLRQAGILHDVGKIGISSSILNKPSALTAEEYEIIRGHPRMGKRILEPIHFLKDVVPVVYHHHEKWDGSGYPEGLRGDDIPLGSRIMAAADTYDAMTSDRAYRKALPHEAAVAELRQGSGRQFDPRCVEAFLQAHGGRDTPR